MCPVDACDSAPRVSPLLWQGYASGRLDKLIAVQADSCWACLVCVDWLPVGLPRSGKLPASNLLTSELTMGQWVMGLGWANKWKGHVGHGSVPMTR